VAALETGRAMKTVRQQMISLLETAPMALRDLSQALRISEKEVKGHLPHIAKTVSARKDRFTVIPARCESCDYAFAGRKRLSPPGKCPRCRQSRIQGPWYQVLT
jgi:predicted Zn-ribbon and HTH transcriptional regulator